MGKKLWALALVGAAAYLYKTKHGAEVRKQIGDFASKAAGQLKEKYGQAAGAAAEQLDAQTA